MGASSVKVISGIRTKSEFVVDGLAVVPLPFRSVDERGVINAEAVSEGIRGALGLLGKKRPRLSTAVRGQGVLTKRVVIPKIPKKEIPDQVHWEAEQVFPVDISTILIDYLILGESANVPGAPPGTAGWDLLLVGVRAEEADTLHSVIEASNGKVAVMDLDAFAVGDFLDGIAEMPKDEGIAMVDVGAAATRVSVRHQGNVVFIREFPFGGNAFTDTLAQALGLSFEDAEALKIQDGSGIPQEAQDALASAFLTWKSELQQCEDIFVSQDNQAVISRWYVFGGGSLTPGLLESLRDERFGDKAMFLPASNFLKAKSKSNVDAALLHSWSPRLLTAAALTCRKGG